MCCWFL